MANLLPPHNSKPDLDPAEGWIIEENDHPIEQVRLTVDPFDNPNQPVFTIRTWILGTTSCILLAFANKFFGYRTNQLSIGPVCIQIVSLPIGRFLAKTMPKRNIKIPFTSLSFSLNPGPFNMKEHCLITIFANSGAGGVYSIHIVTIVRAFYHRKINPLVAFLLAQTTQLLGYGWAGIYRKYLVESPYMWWPSNLVQVSLFKALHQKEKRKRGTLTRFQFFVVIFAGSFAYYVIPGYLFPAISTVSILCLFYKNSVTIQQIGSGMKGLGIGSFGLDWSTVAGFLGSPLGTPASAIFNIMVGYVLVVYGLLPLAYWTNTYNAKSFPLISSHVFDSTAKVYNTTRIIDSRTFTLNVEEQESYSKINMSIMFAICYGLGFATLTSSIMHVALYDGKDIWKSWRQVKDRLRDDDEEKVDVHSRLMKNYEAVPDWWFYGLLVIVIPLSIFTCVGFGAQLQLPWWGILLACAMALFFTLPIGVITATTNQGTKKFGLIYKQETSHGLTGYSDSDWGGSTEDRKSTSGHVFLFGNKPISWSSRKQSTVALSSTEAEYIALCSASCEAIWLQRILQEISGEEDEENEKFEGVPILCDNQSSIALAKNPVFHNKSKHIELKFHYIREMIEKKKIQVQFCPTDRQLADILTKPLGRLKFLKLRAALSVVDGTAQEGVLEIDPAAPNASPNVPANYLQGK